MLASCPPASPSSSGQDTALSRLEHGFDPRWGRQISTAGLHRVVGRKNVPWPFAKLRHRLRASLGQSEQIHVGIRQAQDGALDNLGRDGTEGNAVAAIAEYRKAVLGAGNGTDGRQAGRA